MAARGRPRKSDNDLKKEGTYRKDRHAGKSMKPMPGTMITALPSPPDWLDDLGQKEWERLISLLDKAKMLASTDLGMLTMLCNEWSCYISAVLEIRDTGRFYKTMNNGLVTSTQIHPLHTISQQHLKAYIGMCNEFGLSPASRAKVPHEAPEKEETRVSKLLRKAL
jgi:P27 family predicted phage terminase small subunit